MFITYKIGELSRLGNHRPTQPALFLHARSLPAARSAIPKLRSANPHLRIALPNCSAGRTPQKYSVQCCARKSTTRCPTAHVTNNSCCPTTPTTPAAPPLVQTHHTGTHTHAYTHTYTHIHTHYTRFQFQEFGVEKFGGPWAPCAAPKIGTLEAGTSGARREQNTAKYTRGDPEILISHLQENKVYQQRRNKNPRPWKSEPPKFLTP